MKSISIWNKVCKFQEIESASWLNLLLWVADLIQTCWELAVYISLLKIFPLHYMLVVEIFECSFIYDYRCSNINSVFFLCCLQTIEKHALIVKLMGQSNADPTLLIQKWLCTDQISQGQRPGSKMDMLCLYMWYSKVWFIVWALFHF